MTEPGDNLSDPQPSDGYDRELTEQVRPADWVNPTPTGAYNLVVIGAGTAGMVAAAGAAALGAKVALVEKHLFGGDCLNTGCVPSKSIIRSSRAVADVMGASQFGVDIAGPCTIDFPAVMERMRQVRAEISRHDAVSRFAEMGIDVFLGEGCFTGPDRIEVGGVSLHFKKAVIATGARAFHPPIDGLSKTGFFTNETIFSLTGLPRRLAVIGAGPIGCELAQTFQRLGSEVALLHNHGHILDREDPDAAHILQDTFQREGIRLVLGCAITRVESAHNGKTMTFMVGNAEETLETDEILVGAGRTPNVHRLGLKSAGVEHHPLTGVVVDDFLRTSNARIYAAGDVCMSWKFTHAADAAARIAVQNALFPKRKRLSSLTMPWCTYTDPEIAHVGLCEHEAAAQGRPLRTFLSPFQEVDRALTDGEDQGFVKIHVEEKSDRIVGATIVARHAGEMISEISVAMAARMGLGSLAHVIHPYPTRADAIRQAGDAYNRTRLTPWLKRLLSAWMSWQRR